MVNFKVFIQIYSCFLDDLKNQLVSDNPDDLLIWQTMKGARNRINLGAKPLHKPLTPALLLLPPR